MVLKRQTVWLLSMLTIMVVLSAYYLVQGPVDEMPVAMDQQDEDSPQNNGESSMEWDVETSQITLDDPMFYTMGDNINSETGGDGMTSQRLQGSDFFVAYRMNRDAWNSERMSELMSIMSDTEASAEEIAAAKDEYEKISALQDAEQTVEEIIKSSGYKDAVVVARENGVDVIVQADKLDQLQAVEIIRMVKEHLDVPENNIVVSYKN